MPFCRMLLSYCYIVYKMMTFCCYLYYVVRKSGWTLLRENAIFHFWHQVKYVLIACLVWIRKCEILYVMYVALDWHGKHFNDLYIYDLFLEYTYCSWPHYTLRHNWSNYFHGVEIPFLHSCIFQFCKWNKCIFGLPVDYMKFRIRISNVNIT